MSWHGYTGKILRINLTTRHISVEELKPDFVKMYIGGVGFGARWLWETLKPGIDPLSPDNVLIAVTGPFQGTLVPGSGNIYWVFKSPLTNGWGETRAGGKFGPMLKYAGFDAIIITGKADEPVYIYIENGKAEIRSAKHIWGKTVHETTDILLEEIGRPEASVAAIGPAGEKLVRFAAIMNDYDRAAGRGGGGAVMGSKNLKAIVVYGTQEITPAQPDKFWKDMLEAQDAMSKYMYKDSIGKLGTIVLVNALNAIGALPTMNFKSGYFVNADDMSGEKLAEKYLLKRRACFSCVVGCGRYTWVPSGKYATPAHEGPEYETTDMIGIQTGLKDLDALVRANYLVNNYGLDSISTGNVIAWAIEAYQRGYITKDDTGGLELKWGDSDTVLTLIDMIARRQGFGDVLAEGVKRASEKIGRGTDEFAVHVKGLECPAHDPRGESRYLAIQYAISPRGCCHMHPNWPSYDLGQFDGGLRDYGFPWPQPEPHTELGVNRGKSYRLIALHGMLSLMLGMCVFYLWGTEENAMTPKRIARLYSSLTGIDIKPEELLTAAERVWNLERAFNIREGFTREHDRLPKRFLETIPYGPSKGQAVQHIEELIDETYEAFGWDKKTGYIMRQKLSELGLNDVLEELEKMGKIA